MVDVQPFTNGLICPICGGEENDPRGMGVRCHGFLSSDGNFGHCTREEFAGAITLHPNSLTYAHLLHGSCKCGQTHGPALNGTNGHAKTNGHIKANGKPNGQPKPPANPSDARHDTKTKTAQIDYIYADESRTALYLERRQEFVDRLTGEKSKRVHARKITKMVSGVPPETVSGKGIMKGIRRVLYRLPELLAADPALPVFIVEGPKKVEALRSLGLISTCNPFGAGKWLRDYSSSLAGRHAVILPDKNRVGAKHAETVAYSINTVTTSVQIIDLPRLPDGKDIVDWLAADGTVEELTALVEATPPWDPAPPRPPTIIGGDNPDDMPANESDDDPHRLARLYVAQNFTHDDGPTIVNHLNKFHRWDGSKYSEYGNRDVIADLTGSVKDEFDRLNREAIIRVVEAFQEAGEKIPAPHLLPQSQKVTTGLIANVMQALHSETCIDSDIRSPAWFPGTLEPDEVARLPPPEQILPTVEGLVDLKTLTVLPLTPRFFCPFAVPYAFDPKAPEPKRWIEFLEQLWPGDHASIKELQKWFGYVVTLDKSQEKALLLTGPRRSGKGTIVEVITAMLGPSNVASLTLKGISRPHGLWPLEGKALGIFPDARFTGAGENADILVERLLSLTSRDTVEVEGKHIKQVTVKLPIRLMICTNEIPNLRENSGALAGRFTPLQLTQSYFGREDRNLAAKLLPELGGILKWAIRGHEMLREDGCFKVPQSAEAVHEEFNHLASPILSFVDECCEVLTEDPRPPEKLTPIREIHYAYQWWCRLTKREASSDSIFGRNMHAVLSHLKDERPRLEDGTRPRCYRGIQLNDQGQDMYRKHREKIEGAPRY